MFGAWLRSGMGSKRVSSPYPKHSKIDEAERTHWDTFPVAMGPCTVDDCSLCVDLCPTAAITLYSTRSVPTVDTGACISCALCVKGCPLELFQWNRDVISAAARDDLIR